MADDSPGGYAYLMLSLPPAASGSPHRALADALAAAPSLAAEALGVFAPQLGWRARQAAVLLRSPRGAAEEAVARSLPQGAEITEVDTLTPTLRPNGGDLPRAGGIHVHRWFDIREASLPEFLALSSEGWADFEARFDADIFGLFKADQTPEEAREGRRRLLLLTRYAGHGVWEASRDPSTAAMAAFARRRALTLDSWAASSLLLPVPGGA